MFHRTERLFLRPAWPEDAPALLAQVDEGIARNLATMPWPYGAEDATAFLVRAAAPMLPGFAITLPGQGFIGHCGIGIEPETSEVQIGYWIARAHWGRGYAAEATRAVLVIAALLGHRRIVASHFLDNPASGRVLEKAGLRATGEVRDGHSLARGGYGPVACYAIALG